MSEKNDTWNKMHLQWFGDVDEGGEPSAQDPKFHDVTGGDDEYEVIMPGQPDPSTEEPDAYRGKTREELIAESLARDSREAELRKGADTSAAILEGLRSLRQPAQPQYVQPPVDTYVPPKREEINQKFIDDPYENTNILIQDQLRKLTPELRTALGNMKYFSRAEARRDPSLSYVFEKYSPEVEQEVMSRPPQEQFDPEVYQRAAQSVQARHFVEIRDVAIAKALEEDRKARTNAAPAGRPGGASFNETASRPVGQRSKIVLKPTQEDIRKAENRGMDLKDYMAAVYPNGRTK
jgi:hypothetical protein